MSVSCAARSLRAFTSLFLSPVVGFTLWSIEILTPTASSKVRISLEMAEALFRTISPKRLLAPDSRFTILALLSPAQGTLLLPRVPTFALAGHLRSYWTPGVNPKGSPVVGNWELPVASTFAIGEYGNRTGEPAEDPAPPGGVELDEV